MNWETCFSDIAGADNVATIQCFEVVFVRVVTMITSLASIVFFIILIFGGFRYLTSHGDPKAIEGAKGTITAAFLGIFLIVVAYLVLVIMESFTGVDLTVFTIPAPEAVFN